MLREQQEKLERENEDVRDQNYKLSRLVELSNVQMVEKAQKEKADALKQAAEERKKASATKKNAKDEISKAKRHAEKVISETKRKLSFWRMVAIGVFCFGVLMEWFQLWM